MEYNFFNIKEYVLKTGGASYWAFLYWILYFIFLYEIVTNADNIYFKIVGIFFFCGIGVLLTIGVHRHLKIVHAMWNMLDDQLQTHSKKYQDIVYDFNRLLPVFDTVMKQNPGNEWAYKDCLLLQRKIEQFEQTYFNPVKK